MLAHGSRKRNLIAKVFGGAEQFKNQGTGKKMTGSLNIAVAEDMLKKENIPIISTNVGGPKGRKIIFNTETGLVLLKYVGDSKPSS